MQCENLIQLPTELPQGELFQQLVGGRDFKLQRFISTGQATPPGEWYDQAEAEWVVVLAGAARLQFEGQAELLALQPGDCVHIPSHCRHRVEWTDPQLPTIWLALYYNEDA